MKTIKFIAHEFRLGDVEDPDLYAAQPLIEWEKSEPGKWLMENSDPTPEWNRVHDISTYGYRYAIKGFLTPEKYTYWKLKYD